MSRADPVFWPDPVAFELLILVFGCTLAKCGKQIGPGWGTMQEKL
jgi:hypothetical protein